MAFTLIFVWYGVFFLKKCVKTTYKIIRYYIFIKKIVENSWYFNFFFCKFALSDNIIGRNYCLALFVLYNIATNIFSKIQATKDTINII